MEKIVIETNPRTKAVEQIELKDIHITEEMTVSDLISIIQDLKLELNSVSSRLNKLTEVVNVTKDLNIRLGNVEADVNNLNSLNLKEDK